MRTFVTIAGLSIFALMFISFNATDPVIGYGAAILAGVLVIPVVWVGCIWIKRDALDTDYRE